MAVLAKLTAALMTREVGAVTPGEAFMSVLARDGRASFAPSFLAAVPLDRVTGLLVNLCAEIGPVQAMTENGGSVTLHSDTHLVVAQVTLDEQGRIAGLYLQPAQRLVKDLATAVAELQRLGGEVAVLVQNGDRILASVNADRPLAVASAFKLGILAALQEDIANGDRKWTDTVLLADRHRSLPTGQMQDWPAGSPVTLHTAALLMISISDNTASDLLTDVLGRDRVAAHLGIRPADMLTTREFFALKADPNARADWMVGGSDRPAIAAGAARTLPAISAVSGGHVSGLEWHVSLTRLCVLMAGCADLPLMGVNPGPVPMEPWSRIAYKGGSEPGVLNFTASLCDATGQHRFAAFTWNHHHDLNQRQAVAAYRELLRHLAGSC